VRRARLIAGWTGVAGLAWLAGWLHPGHEPSATPLFLLGPVAPFAAQVQWLRFHAASLRGETPRALELAESALALDPRSSAGWERLAAHLLFDLASREREPALERRRAFFQAGLAVLARGAERAAEPGALEFYRALALIGKAEADPELSQGGAGELYAEALAALERAAARGDARAAELQPQVRKRAADAE